jgi:DNA gyrase subunit A
MADSDSSPPPESPEPPEDDGSSGPPQGARTGERIIDHDIEDELKESYLTYAMSVIISRALPDVRDGLKPSQRRILVAMNDLNLNPRAKHSKCAKIVGECMGKYHPHGDQAIYPTLVRMAQPFNTRYLLVDGQGNFGSIDADPPAAMRYTEARMHAVTGELLQDLDMETVDLAPTFDNENQEPTILPSRFPNLICNGSTGIAVGMATSMPPHNVREVCDALTALVENPDIAIEGLMRHIPGPDFPTGAQICGNRGIREAYRTGRGLIKVRSKYHVEEKKRRRYIVFTEIPYQESKVNVIDRISACVKEGKIKGISDIRDESDKNIRLVIELRGDADENVVVNQLFKHTTLQTTFSIINIALVRGRPETLNLKDLLNEYKRHRMEVIRRRTRYQLRKAEDRAHIVEGLLKALDHIDAIIALIRGSATVEDASNGLVREFAFTEIQAREILNMRLQRLTALERQKLDEELKELRAKIEEYRAILRSERLVLDIILKDLAEIRERYGDERRTEIVAEMEELDIEDLITEEDVVVTVSRDGYIKRTALSTYRSQGRGGRGIMGSTAKEGDLIKDLFVASTHAYILFFTNRGRVYWTKVYNLPDMSRTSRGRSLVNLVQLKSAETVTQQVCVKEFPEDRYVVLATRNGTIKKTRLSAYARPQKNGIIAISLDLEDEVIGAGIAGERDEIILGTKRGMSIRFPQENVRAMGRTAAGVGGIKLRQGDFVVDMVVVDPRVEDLTLLTVCENGYGKRTPVGEYRLQRRNGGGTINIRTTERNGLVIGIKAVTAEDDLVLITQNGILMRMSISDLRTIGRATQGVRLINIKEGDKLSTVERVVAEEKGDTDGEAEAAGSPAAGGSPAETEHPPSEGSDDLPEATLDTDSREESGIDEAEPES